MINFGNKTKFFLTMMQRGVTWLNKSDKTCNNEIIKAEYIPHRTMQLYVSNSKFSLTQTALGRVFPFQQLSVCRESISNSLLFQMHVAHFRFQGFVMTDTG